MSEQSLDSDKTRMHLSIL